MSQARHNSGLTARPFFCLFWVVVLLVLVGCGNSSSSKGGNIPPVASAACDNTPLNTDLTGDLNASVTDPDSPILNFALAGPPSEGVATVDVTGAFTYTPNFNARGTDSFIYQVDDLSGGMSSATVTVIIGDTRIMPLGNSITFGEGELPAGQEVGYRQKLFDDLVSSGYTIDFVGGERDPDPASFDSDHEGHPGAFDDEIATAVFGYLVASPADVVLLHIGTNDINSFGDTDPDDVEITLNEIDNWEASNNPVTVLLARIINFADLDPRVTTFNDAAVAMALARTGDNIVIVNQQAALVPADMDDNLHPKQVGYQKMTDVWFADLTDSMTGPLIKCP